MHRWGGVGGSRSQCLTLIAFFSSKQSHARNERAHKHRIACTSWRKGKNADNIIFSVRTCLWSTLACLSMFRVCVCVGQIGTINAWEIPSVCVYVWMTVLFKYIAVRHLKFSSVNFAEILQHSIIYCCHFSDCRTLGRSVFQHLFVRMTWIMYMAKSNNWAYADYNGNWWSSKCTYHKYISRMMSVPQHT